MTVCQMLYLNASQLDLLHIFCLKCNFNEKKDLVKPRLTYCNVTRLSIFYSVFNINSSSVQQAIPHSIFLTSGSFPCSQVTETLIQFQKSS